jgi:hypothetical protein
MIPAGIFAAMIRELSVEKELDGAAFGGETIGAVSRLESPDFIHRMSTVARRCRLR